MCSGGAVGCIFSEYYCFGRFLARFWLFWVSSCGALGCFGGSWGALGALWGALGVLLNGGWVGKEFVEDSGFFFVWLLRLRACFCFFSLSVPPLGHV